MTSQSDIISDPAYIPVLNHGFVGLVDHMGSDSAIVQSARVSYGAGNKTVREDRGLIRYLFRHRHTSPVEMCEVKFHIRLPIFVMRQLVRHRTSSLNEYSGRYSIMSDEFYMPDADVILPQSKDNKQGRAGDLNWAAKEAIQGIFGEVYGHAYQSYEHMASVMEPGLSRELARCVLPVGAYTELFWKQNLHNLFHLLKLRLDSHAQHEIRVFADAMYRLVQPVFPLACEAFEDYIAGAITMSRMEINLMNALLGERGLLAFIKDNGGSKPVADRFGMSERELAECVANFR